MLAHELRNPLAPVLNALHVLGRESDPARVARARDMAERQVRHMARLVDDLLDISRITRGKIQLRKEPVDVHQIVARAVDCTRPLIEAQRHRLEVKLLPEPVYLEADPTRLEQILANLLNNAAKYTEPGGRIWLTTERDNSEVVVRVRDTGIGIPPDMLPRVFEMFIQVDRSLDRAQGGLGIGLTLVRSLVEMHGGSVEARSAGPGKGSEFAIRLPVLQQLPAEMGESGPEPPLAAGERLRVLMVDDNADAAASVAMLLELEGHRVFLAHDGYAALEASRVHRPDVILLDIGLPGMNGYEAARQLRQQPGMMDVLLVAMTGYGQAEDRRRSSEAGFDHHLVKPVDPDELQELLLRAKVLSKNVSPPSGSSCWQESATQA